MTQISNLLVTLNSSVNFVIYCIYGEKFKRLFCYLFCKPCGGREGNIQHIQRYTTTRGGNHGYEKSMTTTQVYEANAKPSPTDVNNTSMTEITNSRLKPICEVSIFELPLNINLFNVSLYDI